MTPPMTPEALELSRDLAHELGQLPAVQREGRTFVIPSRTRGGLSHRVDWALDGRLYCTCEAGVFGGECWAVKLVREETNMNGTMSTELVPVRLQQSTSLLPTEREYALIDKAARLALSGAVSLPKELNTPAKVGAVMLYGWELGLRPMTALQELYIVNGRVQPSARIMAGLLQSRTDAQIKIVESTDKKCTLRLVWPSRDLDEKYTVEWQEIVTAKLAGRDTWATYPRDKLITHCTKRLLRVYAPDIINGLVGPVFTNAETAEDDDDAEMFNEGEEVIEGHVIDRETGEIVEHGDTQEEPEAQRRSAGNEHPERSGSTPVQSTPPASPPAAATGVGASDYTQDVRQIATILKDLQESMGDSYVDDQIKPALRQLCPQMMTAHNDAVPGRIPPAKTRAVVDYLRRVQSGQVEHEHELSYTPAGEPVCRICEVAMSDEEQPAVAQAGLPV